MPSAPNRTASVIRPVRTHGPGQAIASFKRKTVMSNHPKGLTGAEVEQSRQRYGANVLTPPKRKSLWRLFFEKFNDPVIRILLVAALLSLGIGFIHNEFAEAIGIFCAIFLATGVAFWFEYDAMKKFDVLNSTNDDTPVKVVRDGHVTEIPKRDVVVGDTVILQSGEEVPADGRLTEAVSLKINESTLTGEPQIDKTTDPAHFDPEATYPSDHAMRGTTVIEGHGTMTVTAVGDATEFGHVAEQATVESEEQTPLNLQLQKLSKLIGRVGISLAIVTFVALLVKGMIIGDLLRSDWLTIATEVLQYFMVAVTLIDTAENGVHRHRLADDAGGKHHDFLRSDAQTFRRMLRHSVSVGDTLFPGAGVSVAAVDDERSGHRVFHLLHIHENRRRFHHILRKYAGTHSGNLTENQSHIFFSALFQAYRTTCRLNPFHIGDGFFFDYLHSLTSAFYLTLSPSYRFRNG